MESAVSSLSFVRSAALALLVPVALAFSGCPDPHSPERKAFDHDATCKQWLPEARAYCTRCWQATDEVCAAVAEDCASRPLREGFDWVTYKGACLQSWQVHGPDCSMPMTSGCLDPFENTPRSPGMRPPTAK